MPSDDRPPVTGAVFSKREAILLGAIAMTVVAGLYDFVPVERVVRSTIAYITY